MVPMHPQCNRSRARAATAFAWPRLRQEESCRIWIPGLRFSRIISCNGHECVTLSIPIHCLFVQAWWNPPQWFRMVQASTKWHIVSKTYQLRFFINGQINPFKIPSIPIYVGVRLRYEKIDGFKVDGVQMIENVCFTPFHVPSQSPGSLRVKHRRTRVFPTMLRVQ